MSKSSEQFVEELSAADARHDGYAASLGLFAEAYRRIPEPSEADVAAWAQLQPALIPQSGEFRGTYATQASRAVERNEAATDAHREALARFPLTEGRTLLNLFDGYVEAGRHIDTMLRQRADAAQRSGDDRAKAGVLRGSAIGVLGQLRDAIGVELRNEPERAASVDRAVFAYIDLLQASRAKGGPGAPPPPPPV